MEAVGSVHSCVSGTVQGRRDKEMILFKLGMLICFLSLFPLCLAIPWHVESYPNQDWRARPWKQSLTTGQPGIPLSVAYILSFLWNMDAILYFITFVYEFKYIIKKKEFPTGDVNGLFLNSNILGYFLVLHFFATAWLKKHFIILRVFSKSWMSIYFYLWKFHL